MIVDEKDLAHFGTKGMKWGVRKKRPERTPQQKSDIRRQRRQTASVLLVGAGIAALLLSGNSGKTPARNTRQKYSTVDFAKLQRQSDEIFRKAGTARVVDIRQGFSVARDGTTTTLKGTYRG